MKKIFSIVFILLSLGAMAQNPAGSSSNIPTAIKGSLTIALDSPGTTPLGGFLYREFSTGKVRVTPGSVGGGGITSLTGDATGSGSGAVALTFATVNSSVGTFGTATQVPQFTVNAKGLITGVSNVTISTGGSGITGLTTTRVPFASSSTTLTDDNNFNWDNTAKALNIAGSTSASTLRIGTTQFQTYAVNNTWIGDNEYYDGTNNVLKAAGYANKIQFYTNEIQIRHGATGSAGSTVSDVLSAKFSLNGTVAIGGSIDPVGGSFAGSALKAIGSNNHILINTQNDVSNTFLNIEAANNGNVQQIINNTTSGTAANAVLKLQAGTAAGYLYVNSQGFSGAPNAMYINNGSNPVWISGSVLNTPRTLFAASVTGGASVNIPSGTAPTSPIHGDMWTDASHIYSRLNGVTYQLDQQSSGLSGLTTNDIMWAASSSTVGQSNNFNWDNTNQALNIGGSTTNTTLRVGSLEAQNYSIGNSWLGDNTYFDGTNFKFRGTGYASLFYWFGSEQQFRISNASGSAGGTVTSVIPLKINKDMSVHLGGNIFAGAGTYSGASLDVTSALVTANVPTVLAAPTTTTTSLFFPSGTKKTTMSNGDMLYDGTHLYFHSTSDFDLLAAGGYTLPTATTSVLGGVKVDGTTITIASGVISAAGGTTVTSSTYTPTLTGTTNITGTALNSATYIRVGNIVHVTISALFTTTAAATASVLTVTLPITTATTQSSLGVGVVPYSGGTKGVGDVNYASTTTATFNFVASLAVSAGCTLEFQYQL